MKREERYIVFKLGDVDAVLTPQERTALYRIGTKVLAHRQKQGKEPLQCVVVEHDWPEYEPTWAAIAARVAGASPSGASAEDTASSDGTTVL